MRPHLSLSLSLSSVATIATPQLPSSPTPLSLSSSLIISISHSTNFASIYAIFVFQFFWNGLRSNTRRLTHILIVVRLGVADIWDPWVWTELDMENLISLVNRLQRACTALGDHGEESALPTLWDALPSIAVVGGQVIGIYVSVPICVCDDYLFWVDKPFSIDFITNYNRFHRPYLFNFCLHRVRYEFEFQSASVLIPFRVCICFLF